jgi:hypothetical protein
MLTDTSEIRSKYETNAQPIPSASFQVRIAKGESLPINDWNLVEDRIHVMLVSFNVLNQAPFGIAPNYGFKVRPGSG